MKRIANIGRRTSTHHREKLAARHEHALELGDHRFDRIEQHEREMTRDNIERVTAKRQLLSAGERRAIRAAKLVRREIDPHEISGDISATQALEQWAATAREIEDTCIVTDPLGEKII